ncbi:MAG: nucleotidyltransferase family protein [Syntrophales bacterium]|nr:nucleotidyltransferase family protein [Syntrophales bacterium]
MSPIFLPDLRNTIDDSFAYKHTIVYNPIKIYGVTTMRSGLTVPQGKIREFCLRNHIRKLALFGSVLRDDFGPESDIDVLVEFDSGAEVGFFELYDMEEELSLLFGGRKIEIVTQAALSKYFRDEVISRAEVQYAAT